MGLVFLSLTRAALVFVFVALCRLNWQIFAAGWCGLAAGSAGGSEAGCVLRLPSPDFKGFRPGVMSFSAAFLFGMFCAKTGLLG